MKVLRREIWSIDFVMIQKLFGFQMPILLDIFRNTFTIFATLTLIKIRRDVLSMAIDSLMK